MDFNNFFRGFFGFNRMNPEKFDVPFSDRHFENWHSESQDGARDDIDSFFDDQGMPSILQHMEDMFNNMFSIHGGFLDFPNLEAPQEHFENPRDIMLRDGSSNGLAVDGLKLEPKNGMIDSDLDDRVAKGGLSTLEETNLIPHQIPQVRSFRKSVSTRIVRSPDGVVEEHRTVTDADGKTVTTVRKSIGSQTYQVTTESDKKGLLEKKEDFVNIDENDISEFEKRFSRSGSFSPFFKKPNIEQQIEMAPALPPGDSKYSSIFKRFFG